jgi:hypothetical protein
MTHQDPERLPDDLREVDERLRAHKPEVSPLELDRVKLRTMARASRASTSSIGRTTFMRSKLVTMMLVLGLAISGGTAGVIAGGDGGKGKGADKGEYKPGKGCGDKNHTHTGPPGNPSNDDCPDKDDDHGNGGGDDDGDDDHGNGGGKGDDGHGKGGGGDKGDKGKGGKGK